MKKKILLVIGCFLILLIGAAGWKLVYPPAFFPHDRIIIRVPYDYADIPEGMIPMGETVYHPKPKVPNGHPGIDFSWNSGESHALVSAFDGTVISFVKGGSEPDKWDVEIQSGVYVLRYKEMEDYNPAFKVGSAVIKGDLVGHAGHYCDQQNGQQHCWFNIHWEFGSMSNIKDRYCPLTYFDAESLKSINDLWATVPSTDKVKSLFPNICDGDYKDKVE